MAKQQPCNLLSPAQSQTLSQIYTYTNTHPFAITPNFSLYNSLSLSKMAQLDQIFYIEERRKTKGKDGKNRYVFKCLPTTALSSSQTTKFIVIPLPKFALLWILPSLLPIQFNSLLSPTQFVGLFGFHHQTHTPQRNTHFIYTLYGTKPHLSSLSFILLIAFLFFLFISYHFFLFPAP